MITKMVFDGDGTLLIGSNPYLEISEKIGEACLAEIKALVQVYLQNPTTDSYIELCNQELAVFKKYLGELFTAEHLLGLVPEPVLIEGAGEMLRELVRNGVDVHLLSSGFKKMMMIFEQFGLLAENIHANEVLAHEIEGVTLQIDVSGVKIDAFRAIVGDTPLTEVVYFGDNQWDYEVMLHVLQEGGFVVLVEHPENDNDKKKMVDEHLAELGKHGERFKRTRGFPKEGELLFDIK